jgi:hypothetical protein
MSEGTVEASAAGSAAVNLGAMTNEQFINHLTKLHISLRPKARSERKKALNAKKSPEQLAKEKEEKEAAEEAEAASKQAEENKARNKAVNKSAKNAMARRNAKQGTTSNQTARNAYRRGLAMTGNFNNSILSPHTQAVISGNLLNANAIRALKTVGTNKNKLGRRNTRKRY